MGEAYGEWCVFQVCVVGLADVVLSCVEVCICFVIGVADVVW